MQFDLPKAAPAATTMQFESEPAGAEAKTSLGQSCRTPCSLAVTSNEFTVNFALAGYQSQTVPVRVVTPTEPQDPNSTDPDALSPRLVPNPVFVQLQPATAAAAHKKPAPKKKPKAAPRPAPTAMAPAEPAPAPAPASPWPPPR